MLEQALKSVIFGLVSALVQLAAGRISKTN